MAEFHQRHDEVTLAEVDGGMPYIAMGAAAPEKSGEHGVQAFRDSNLPLRWATRAGVTIAADAILLCENRIAGLQNH